MKYDDASWHYGGDFPNDLPIEAGATHIGMFVAWALLNGLGGSLYTEEFPEDLELLRGRQKTPGIWLMDQADGKFIDEELNDEGNAFALAYFGDTGGMGRYVDDYGSVLGVGLPTTYHVSDSWENYDKLAPTIDRRFREWKEGELQPISEPNIDIVNEKPWWKFW